MVRLETRIRQIQLERSAAELACSCFPSEAVGALDHMLVVRAPAGITCLELRASTRPLSRRRLSAHTELRSRGYRVTTCRSESEVRLVLASLGRRA